MGAIRNRKSLHDAELIALSVDHTSSIARFDFRLVDGEYWTAELQGIKSLRGADLSIQNVVSRVLQSTMQDLSVEDLTYWVTWSTSLSDANSWLNEQRRSDWINALRNGLLELIVFEPSAGAEIAAVCERFQLVQRA
jgi:hypothetical protein